MFQEESSYFFITKHSQNHQKSTFGKACPKDSLMSLTASSTEEIYDEIF